MPSTLNLTGIDFPSTIIKLNANQLVEVNNIDFNAFTWALSHIFNTATIVIGLVFCFTLCQK